MSRVTVAVDPGKRHAGVAIFAAGTLQAAVKIRGRNPQRTAKAVARWVCSRLEAMGIAGALWVVEDQQDYPGRDGRTPDLDALRETVRTLRDLVGPWVAEWRAPTPWQWKGHVPKAVHHTRTRQALHETELAWAAGHLTDHDVADAIALGLWACGRAGRGGTHV